MKKFFLFLFSFYTISFSAFAAKVIIYSPNEKYDATLTYQICASDQDHKNMHCGAIKSVTIPARKNPKEQNFVVMFPPPLDQHPIIDLVMLSAIEKDESGVIISRGDFADQAGENSQCIASMKKMNMPDNAAKLNAAIALNDMQSPYILCQVSSFYTAL